MAKDLKPERGVGTFCWLAVCLLHAQGQPPQVEAAQEHNQLLQPGKLLKQPLEA